MRLERWTNSLTGAADSVEALTAALEAVLLSVLGRDLVGAVAVGDFGGALDGPDVRVDGGLAGCDGVAPGSRSSGWGVSDEKADLRFGYCTWAALGV